jgi:SAM-dependent methyltransferase
MKVDSNDYKTRTMHAYDVLAGDLVEGFENYFESIARVEANHFLALLGQCSIILDLGCGGGQTSSYFASQGHTVVSSDLSREMLAACRRRGLKSILRLDLEVLPFRRYTFDAIWAHTSLIHIPKRKLANALQALAQRLGSGGVLFVALKEGTGERYLGEPGIERWFASFQANEFEEHVPIDLEIVRRSRTRANNTAFLNYHLAKSADLIPTDE